MADNNNYKEVLAEVFDYAKKQDYAGYSKYDALNSPLLTLLSFNSNFLKWGFAQFIYRFPINLRPLLAVAKGKNPKALGLFALAYLLAAKTASNTNHDQAKTYYLEQAQYLLEYLSENRAKGYSGMACGYNYVWPNLRFTAPKNSPNLVVTGNVIIAFLMAYEHFQEDKYLEIARSSIDFILEDLNTLIDTSEERAISYIPGSQWIVLNNQGLAAVLMAWTAKYTQEKHLIEMAQRHIQFLVKQQTEYGAWYYAHPPQSSPVTHDNYHTGNVLDWILYYMQLTGDDRFKENYKKGLEFYKDNLFVQTNFMPKHRYNVTYPADIHSAAQGGITFSRAALYFDPQYLSYAKRSLDWAIHHMRTTDGGFYYMKNRWGINKTRLMHWNEGLMSVALAQYLLALEKNNNN